MTVQAENSLPVQNAPKFIPIDNSSACPVSIRVTINDSGVSERHEHSVRGIVSGNLIWAGNVSSFECGPSTIAYGTWYPLAAVAGVPYKYTFVVKAECTKPIKGRYCIVSLKVGNNIYDYGVSTDEPLFFSKEACGIVING
jgi:hypothetical protein